MSILPWRSRCDRPIPDAHRTEPPDESIAIDAIAVANDVLRRLLPAICLSELTRNPIRRSDARSHLATECHGGNAAGLEIRTTDEIVGTTSKSIDAMQSVWLRKKVFHPCDGGRLGLTMYFATVVCPISIPSMRSSPWIRGAPQSGFATLMSRMSSRISIGVFGRPPRALDFKRQSTRKPARCQRITVSGLRIFKASSTPGAKRYSAANTKRSMLLRATRFGALRCSTLSWCRRTRISASSRVLDWNSLVSAHASNLRKSIIGNEHRPIRDCSLAG
jgi:hypothetical protein